MKILILGAGPTGLGAAWRLAQLGHDDWELWEQESIPGGLSRSLVDERGFTWDLGGHVQFSHYRTFDRVMDETLGPEEWLLHERESWVRSFGTWVPYPYQYNIHRLPKEQALRCFKGLLAAQPAAARRPFTNFEEMIRGCFGEGLAEIFMLPYNYKVWGYPARELAAGWIDDRVALPDLGRISESLILGQDNISWGPNNTFRFPRRGGTGAIWKNLAAALPAERIRYNRRAVGINPQARTVTAADGAAAEYDCLITTIPLDILVELAGLDSFKPEAEELKYSAVHVVGVGLKGQPGPQIKTKCWMYFPEDNCPFFRATVFSNYSPNNVPDIGQNWSLMAEVAQTPHKCVDRERVVEETLQGMLNTGLIDRREQVLHTWLHTIPRAYPTPTLERDRTLKKLLPGLEQMGIYSRGRFGAWVYEVSNQDHSFMQGVEAVNHMLLGAPELTLWFPNLVNGMHPVYGKEWL